MSKKKKYVFSAKVLAGIIATLLAGGSAAGYKVIRDNQADIFENSLHQVTYVVDGDTLDIEGDKRIRLLGISAPERGECFYKESRDFLKDLVDDKYIKIEKDVSGADRYGRLLRYIFIPADNPEDDDIFVQEKMLREGYATTLHISPDNRYADLFSTAQEEAKRKDIGIWKACDLEEEARTDREIDTMPSDKDCTIKGNISERGYGKIYFMEGCPNYNTVKIDTRKGEQYFCTEKEAQKAGFTKSESCGNTF